MNIIKDLYNEYIKLDLKYDARDIARFDYAEKLVVGRSCCDVGCGPGFFCNLLAKRNKYIDIYAFDINTHTKIIKNNRIKYIFGDISKNVVLPKSDTIVCMEVLEHLAIEDTDTAINNLRNSTSIRLVLTVPFNEKEPLWWHNRPGGHRQSFNLQRIEKLFPNAYGTIFPRYSLDWIFIVEDVRFNQKNFTIIEKNELLNIL